MTGKTEQQERENQASLNRLYELALALAGDPAQVLDQVTAIVSELLDIAACAVVKVEDQDARVLSLYLNGSFEPEGLLAIRDYPFSAVFGSASPVITGNALAEFPDAALLQKYGFNFFAGIPVLSNGNPIAALCLMHGNSVDLGADNLQFLRALSSRVAIEIERASQRTEMEVVQAQLDIYGEISRLRNLDETLQLIVDNGKRILGVDIIGLALRDEADNSTRWKAVAGFRTDIYRQIHYPAGRSTAGRAISSRKTVLLEGIGIRPDLPAEEFPVHTAEGVTNALGVPLLQGERVLGALIAGYRSGKKLSSLDVKVAEALAAQASIAIENARLYTGLQSANERLVQSDRQKSELLAELMTPVIPVWNKILLAPIIGKLNRLRAEQMTDAILQKASDTCAEVIILDITGVASMDTGAAQNLLNTANAIRLLGATCVLTGIPARAAHKLAGLGLDFTRIVTRRRLSDGLEYAMGLIRSPHLKEKDENPPVP